MARGINKLSALAVQKAKDPGYYGDGGGLWLQVSKLGGKSWVFRYTRNGKTRDMGLGPVHTISLSEARSKSLEHRKSLLEGTDPLEAKKAKQQESKLEAARHKTFKECALAYIQANRAGWKNPKHVQQWENTLEAYAYPIIGELAIGAVDTNLVLKVLQQQVGSPSEPAQFWYTKAETASRLRGRIENILDWATFRGYRQGENPARWKGHLEHELPARSKVQKVEHHASLPYAEAPAFMRDLGKRKGVSARALEFSILTACRSGEVRGAEWSEINFKESTWTIPAARMKAGKEHSVPLSPEAVQLLKSLPRTADSPYVFPSPQGKQLSDMSLTAVLRRMDVGHLTQHGFRSTFRIWAAEQTHHPREVCEHALAHKLPNSVEAAYQRGTLWPKRVQLMHDWAQYCFVLSENKGSYQP
ncbi:tyrosine-type recombinase/integrase [Pseudomonas putida]|uniref:tyrosine-type recombinase/integrase n=1 Tax=Pseudomonas putida TaxID=303 RepID=UPI0007514408|nr:site-specific integrase [Pseudomonas putida]MCE0879346.1 tyrosine-type recombinase/integrase [Pseudomonas putida]